MAAGDLTRNPGATDDHQRGRPGRFKSASVKLVKHGSGSAGCGSHLSHHSKAALSSCCTHRFVCYDTSNRVVRQEESVALRGFPRRA